MIGTKISKSDFDGGLYAEFGVTPIMQLLRTKEIIMNVFPFLRLASKN